MSRRICLVIGLSEELDEVEQEVEEVIRAAEDCGVFYSVHKIVPPSSTVEQFEEVLFQAAKDLTDNSLLLVYYAGHGTRTGGDTWIKLKDGQTSKWMALETEILKYIATAARERNMPPPRSLDIALVFSCCQVFNGEVPNLPLEDQVHDSWELTKMYACEPGAQVDDCVSVLLGFAFAYYLRKRPATLQDLLESVKHDVQNLSLNQIKPYIDRDSQPGTSILQHGLLFACLLVICEMAVLIVSFPLSNFGHDSYPSSKLKKFIRWLVLCYSDSTVQKTSLVSIPHHQTAQFLHRGMLAEFSCILIQLLKA